MADIFYDIALTAMATKNPDGILVELLGQSI